MNNFLFDYEAHEFRSSSIIHADCMEWLSRAPENSIQAIVTDPPYGFREYELDELKNWPPEAGDMAASTFF